MAQLMKLTHGSSPSGSLNSLSQTEDTVTHIASINYRQTNNFLKYKLRLSRAYVRITSIEEGVSAQTVTVRT
eukprot:5123485-Amphidinium_carterae.1